MLYVKKPKQSLNKPHFFLVGAPKCGTTALYEYLSRHPDIFLPKKEIYFFGKDFSFRQPRPNLDYYLSLFQPAKPRQCIGEASVWYLYSKSAAREIKAFQPQAKIIILLRNPVEMLYSLHSQQLYNGNEHIENFEAALAAETSRRQGKNLPPLIGCPYEATYYSEVAKYYEQVKRYVEVFGNTRIKVIVFDDFISDTATVYRETLQFLGVNPNFTTSFERINPNKKTRSTTFRNLLKQRSHTLIRLGKLLLPSRKVRQWLLQKLWQLNTQYTERRPMQQATYQKLQASLREDIKKTSLLLNINLDAWLED